MSCVDKVMSHYGSGACKHAWRATQVTRRFKGERLPDAPTQAGPFQQHMCVHAWPACVWASSRCVCVCVCVTFVALVHVIRGACVRACVRAWVCVRVIVCVCVCVGVLLCCTYCMCCTCRVAKLWRLCCVLRLLRVVPRVASVAFL